MTYTIAQWAIIALVVGGIIAIAYVGLKKAGIEIPDWIIKILWIIVVVVVCVFAIKLLLRLVA